MPFFFCCDKLPFFFPLIHSKASFKFCTPVTSIPSTSLASCSFSNGIIQRQIPCFFASITTGSTPGTLCTAPSSPSSPRIRSPFVSFCATVPREVKIAMAIGRSNAAPRFRIVAGDRLITVFFAGNSKPEFRIAVRTRSPASFTSDERYPTI